MWLSDVWGLPRSALFRSRRWEGKDIAYVVYMTAMHGLALLAPWTFTPRAGVCAAVMYFVSGCLGITVSYHRQLTHRSFKSPKWVEHALAYCGILAVQGDPMEWVRARVSGLGYFFGWRWW